MSVFYQWHCIRNASRTTKMKYDDIQRAQRRMMENINHQPYTWCCCWWWTASNFHEKLRSPLITTLRELKNNNNRKNVFFLRTIKKPQAIFCSVFSVRSIANKKEKTKKYSNIPLVHLSFENTRTHTNSSNERTYIFSVWNLFGIPWHWSFRWWYAADGSLLRLFLCGWGCDGNGKKRFFSLFFISYIAVFAHEFRFFFSKMFILFYVFR